MTVEGLPDWLPEHARGKHLIHFGNDHYGQWVSWAPDRELNPQYGNLPDVEKWGMIIHHLTPWGDACMGMITLEGPIQKLLEPSRSMWQVYSIVPGQEHFEPSVLCRALHILEDGTRRECLDHGFIRNGRWVAS